MAFTSPFTAVTGATILASQWNTYGRDNLNAIWVFTTQGDLIYGNSSTTAARLGIGAAQSILKSTGSIPAWSTVSALLQLAAMVSGQAAGDLFYANAATTIARLASPAAASSLTIAASGTAPAWTTQGNASGEWHAITNKQFDAGGQTIAGVTPVDITNATVNIVTTVTCTILMISMVQFAAQVAGQFAEARAVIGGTAQSAGYPGTSTATYTAGGWAHYRTGVGAGTITCKLQGFCNAAGDTGIYGAGKIVVVALVE